MSDIENFLGGAPALKFPTKGTVHTLTITDEPAIVPQRDFDSGEILTWPDGNVRKQMVITGVIPEDDREDDEDDGERRLFIKGGMTAALRQGLREAKAKVPEIGGTIVVEYVKDGPKEGRKNPPKIYEIEYAAPKRKAKAATASEFLGTDDDDEEETPAPRKGRIAREVEEAKANVKRRRRQAEEELDDDEAPF